MRLRMRHLAALTLVAALTAAVPAAPAAKRKPVTSVRVAQCAKGSTVAERHAIFRGAMRRVRGSERMWMKFRLQERVGGLRPDELVLRRIAEHVRLAIGDRALQPAPASSG